MVLMMGMYDGNDVGECCDGAGDMVSDVKGGCGGCSGG